MADTKITADDEDIKDDQKSTDEDDTGESGEKTTKKNDEDADEDDEDDDTESDEDEDADDEVVPPVRKSVAQHIITRQKNTIKKLRSKKDEDDDSADDDSDDNDTNVYDEDAKKAIGAEVQKQLNPLIKTLASKADEDELNDLFASEPEAKKYAKRIRAYMQSEHYQGVPPAVIFHHLAFEKAAESTNKKKDTANFEANQSRNAGTGRRSKGPKGEIPTVDDMEGMDDKEFEKLERQAKTGKFKKE